jgi:hypothetical protein
MLCFFVSQPTFILYSDLGKYTEQLVLLWTFFDPSRFPVTPMKVYDFLPPYCIFLADLPIADYKKNMAIFEKVP